MTPSGPQKRHENETADDDRCDPRTWIQWPDLGAGIRRTRAAETDENSHDHPRGDDSDGSSSKTFFAFEDLLQKYRTPALLLQGKLDTSVPWKDVADFATRCAYPNIELHLFADGDHRRVDRSDWPRIALLGVIWMAIPLSMFPFAEERVSSALTGMLNGANPIFTFGSEEQRQRWLPDLCAGRRLGAFGLTEPDAGSDAGNVRTRATLHAGGWVVNGAKQFITNAGTDISGVVCITAKTGDDEISNDRLASIAAGHGPGDAMMQAIGDASSGAKTAQEAMDSLCAEQEKVRQGLGDWLELAAFSQPATEVGGDYYDWFVLSPSRVVLAELPSSTW